MSSALWALLYRERRRLALVSCLAFAAGGLFYWPTHIYLGSVHISLVTGAIYAGVVGLAALMVCAFLPSMRFMIEAVAFARLALAFFVLAFPQIGFQILTSPLLTALIVVGGGAVVSRVIHGKIVRETKGFWKISRTPRSAVFAEGGRLQKRFVAWVEDSVQTPATA